MWQQDMVTALMEALEEAGCLENTVIVLTNDHYSYGFHTSRFNELAGESLDVNFGIYENCFICYNAGMEALAIVQNDYYKIFYDFAESVGKKS